MIQKNNIYIVFSPSADDNSFFKLANSLKENDEIYIIGGIVLNRSRKVLDFLTDNKNSNIHCLLGVNEILMLEYIEQVNYLQSDINTVTKFIYREKYNVIRHLWLVKNNGHCFLDFNNDVISNRKKRNRAYRFLKDNCKRSINIKIKNRIINITNNINDVNAEKLNYDTEIEDNFVINSQDEQKQLKIKKLTKAKNFYVIKL